METLFVFEYNWKSLYIQAITGSNNGLLEIEWYTCYFIYKYLNQPETNNNKQAKRKHQGSSWKGLQI